MRQEVTSSSSDLTLRVLLKAATGSPSPTFFPPVPPVPLPPPPPLTPGATERSQPSISPSLSPPPSGGSQVKKEKSTYSQKEASSQAGFRESPCPQPGLGIKETAEDKEGFKALEQGERKGPRKFIKPSVREGIKREPCWAEGLGRSAHLTLGPVRNLQLQYSAKV